jgi:adenylate cyclase
MSTEDVKRKLSAILSADVQGYSRLMGDDERATVETITAYRRIMTDLILSHNGRVVDAKGDNMLAEFSSVVDETTMICTHVLNRGASGVRSPVDGL